MKNKFLIFGGVALVIGVGAYLWYKNSLKNTKNETTPNKTPDNSSIVYDKKSIYLNNKLGKYGESHQNTNPTFTTSDSWKTGVFGS